MSYQVLARKWRPKNFHELVGQEHVLQALVNALDSDRLHHAYLFTGTRGVGKTTIARILSKCLNCETGVSSKPCGTCASCQEVDEGRFIDLIEVDAASRTKVEDTRELLENVQYAPTRGRYKVYLIDEVHMLSSNSFNALLKTLEEPPPHVKFLLATTDPQKLPITILSRCLQFNLKNISPDRIVGHLKMVLEKEMIPFEEPALWELGRAADGSMRDAMSLTDQAIAFGNEKLTEVDVRSMLGSIDRKYVFQLADALVSANASQMLNAVSDIAENSPDYSALLAELISLLHRIAIGQVLPEAIDDSLGDRQRILDLAVSLSAEDVQLYYQVALLGRKDLPLVPEARSGLEMILLRMLTFKPEGIMPPSGGGNSRGSLKHTENQSELPKSSQLPKSSADSSTTVTDGRAAFAQARAVITVPATVSTTAPTAIRNSQPDPVSQTQASDLAEEKPVSVINENNVVPIQPNVEFVAESESKKCNAERPLKNKSLEIKNSINRPYGDVWADLIPKLELSGGTLNLAKNCVLKSNDNDLYHLLIHPNREALVRDEHIEKITVALKNCTRQTVKVLLEVQISDLLTPDQLLVQRKKQRLEEAKQSLRHDPLVNELLNRFGAQLLEDSIQPIDK